MKFIAYRYPALSSYCLSTWVLLIWSPKYYFYGHNYVYADKYVYKLLHNNNNNFDYAKKLLYKQIIVTQKKIM